MNWVAIGLIILMVTILLIVIIVMSKLTVYAYFNHYNGNNHLQLEFKVWFGLVKYRVDVPLPTANEDSGSAILNEEMEHDGTNPSQEYGKDPGGDLGTSLNEVKKLLDEMGQLHRILKNFLKQIAIKHLEWHSVVGVGDAASTAVLTGGIWALKGSIIGMISSYMKLKMMPVLSIAPGFQQVISETSFTCMLQFRIGHAMVAGIKMIKFGKGAGLRFITKPFSAHSENKAKSI